MTRGRRRYNPSKDGSALIRRNSLLAQILPLLLGAVVLTAVPPEAHAGKREKPAGGFDRSSITKRDGTVRSDAEPDAERELLDDVKRHDSAGTFNRGRCLREYKNALGRDFQLTLEALDETEQWLDSGAGYGRAAAMYFGDVTSGWQSVKSENSANRARVTLVSLDNEVPTDKERGGCYHYDFWTNGATFYRMQAPDGPHPLIASEKVRRFAGRGTEDIPSEELTKFGKFQLISDLYGAAAYSPNIGRVLEKYREILDDEVGKVFISALGLETHFVRTKSGDQVDLITWILSLEQFRSELKTTEDKLTTLVLMKSESAKPIPKLRLDKYGEGKLPRPRFFTEID